MLSLSDYLDSYMYKSPLNYIDSNIHKFLVQIICSAFHTKTFSIRTSYKTHHKKEIEIFMKRNQKPFPFL